MAADSAYGCTTADLTPVDDPGGYERDPGDDDLSIDIETLVGILEENSGPEQDTVVDPSSDDFSQQYEAVAGNAKKSQHQSGTQATGGFPTADMDRHLSSLEPSKNGEGLSSGSFDCNVNVEPLVSSPSFACSASFKDWFLHNQEVVCTDRACHSEMPSCSTSTSSSDRDDMCNNPLKHEAGTELSSHVSARGDSSAAISRKDSSDIIFEYYSDMLENGSAADRAPESAALLDLFSTESTNRQIPNVINDANNYYSLMSYCSNMDDNILFPEFSPCHTTCNGNIQCLSNNDDISNSMEDEAEILGESTSSSIEMTENSQARDDFLLNVPWDYQAEKGWNFNTEGHSLFPVKANNYMPGSLPYASIQMPISCANEEKIDMTVHEGGSPCNVVADTSVNKSLDEDQILPLNISEQGLPDTGSCSLSNGPFEFPVHKKLDLRFQLKDGIESNISLFSSESTQSNLEECRFVGYHDPDIYIVEDDNQPFEPNEPIVPAQSSFALQPSVPSGTFNHYGAGPTRVGVARARPNNEQMIFQAALQGLSQPTSEAAPPADVLAVPLLRHQRIALSWMVQKETASLHCLGGILADDQGLGKTVSTIALILKERPRCQQNFKKCQPAILNLDDENPGNAASENNKVEQEPNYSQASSNEDMKNGNTFGRPKGRPAAGTLIVCPTSVLRQWADELSNKVTSRANLSVLVYHGSNRTKDPYELAKYDVVLTTYSIVTMEVPKQPLNEEEEGKGGFENDAASAVFSVNKKRKYSPTCDENSSSSRKATENGLSDSLTRPLSKVGWFRVVLDEAQSIKNHKTQAARACWGLRAKRRWCLSGTPIQNAIDDLYSYFRFLRYDPYAVYNTFRTMIKYPISRNPINGYKKLQAVLKPIMLRRTKGTHLDGKPIISLPPKVVELRRVDFTKEERDFYTRLENESRNQFKEYARAGTVQQNYVNILLMLLRLRQACDHPLLVKGRESNSMWKPSLHMAKKLPREKRKFLLNCLEASLAICAICNDAPEDAVVSLCGHVFCKQCICDHLTGDINHCPAANCKVPLDLPSVFSRVILNSSLSEVPWQETSVDLSTSELANTVEPCQSLPYDSSKIKAAIEVLESLSENQNCALKHDSQRDPADENGMICESSSVAAAGSGGDSLNRSPDMTVVTADSRPSDLVTGSIREKAIVFSQWTKMLDLLEICLKNSSIQYRRLDGTMSVFARDRAVKDFNTLPEVSVMIMSLKAASLGLNMVAASRVLLLDLWWNPTTEDQAIDRAHRIGQTRPVTVVRLTVKDTVEDRILALQQKKRAMVAAAFGEDETGGRQSRLTVNDLNYLFMMDS